MIEAAPSGILQRAGFHQFIKFCIIGLSSTIIDLVIWKGLINKFGWDWTLAQIVSFCFSVTNGFIWNSLWTFRGMGSSKRHQQYIKFIAVNLVGLGLTELIIKSVLTLISGHLTSSGAEDSMHLNIAKGIAIVCVATWNFIANKKWTFS